MIVNNWRAVLNHAWSVRVMIAAAFFSGLEVRLPLLDGYFDIPPRILALLSGLTVAAAFIARRTGASPMAELLDLSALRPQPISALLRRQICRPA